MQQVDVLIAGGGLAGVYLAYLLEQEGINYQLLEAKSRLGGRILGEATSQDSALQVDLGPTWFWPHQVRIQGLLKQLNIDWFEQYTQGDALYQLAQNTPAQRTPGAGAMLSYRIHGGMQTLINGLAQKLDTGKLLLSHPVSAIEKTEAGWQVSSSTNNKTYLAKQLLIAMPPRVLVNTIATEQWLPEKLYTAFKSTPTWMAAQAKFVATYKKAFWREAGLAGDAFSRIGPMLEIHDSSASLDGGYALFGFIGVPAQSREQFPEDNFKQMCLQQLVSIFGPEAAKPEAIYFKDWAKDHYVCTTQDINETPMHPNLYLPAYKKELAEINIDFAGTEYATEEAGYLEGALASAEHSFKKLIQNAVSTKQENNINY